MSRASADRSIAPTLALLDFSECTGITTASTSSRAIATRIARCCGDQTQEGTFFFRKSGRRRFWRLDNPHRERFCDKYTCHYYIDLFDRR